MKRLTPFLFYLLLVFVGAMFLCRYLGILQPVLFYSEMENRKMTSIVPVIQTDNYDELELPSYYNSIDAGRINRTRDQGEMGACWAFAANAAMESRLLPEEQWDFSEDHMIHNNGFYGDGTDGGDFYMAVAYLAGWKGPVTEDQDPYNDGATNPDAPVVKHLQEAYFLDQADLETIKKMVYLYGAAESSIHIAIDEDQYINETYYNKYDYTYCYNGEEEENHEIVIIGWDDDYPSENFQVGATRDGAFICLNSWGAEFGDNGIFYISYDDRCIGQSVEVFHGLESPDNYDHIYQYDEHGWVGRMGFEQSGAFFANIFTAQGSEELDAVAFYATGEDTSYTVYVCRNYKSLSELFSGRELEAQGTFLYSGYYTVKLDEPISLEPGEQFAIVVKINTPESLHPVAIEMDDGEGRTGEVQLAYGKSYISPDGRTWENAQEESECNICLKAFTSDR